MASRESAVRESTNAAQDQLWTYHPELPLGNVPVFVWPLRIVDGLKYIFSRAYLLSVIIPFGSLAAFTWYFLQPAMERCVALEPGWIAQLFARNLVLIFIVAGGLHLYFYVFKLQGTKLKFDSQVDMPKDNHRFFMNNQVWDNMLYTLASGVTIWTAYEVFFFWAYANNFLPHYLEIRNHPISFVLIFLIIPFWSSLHFHFAHRLLHWRPLFKLAHAVHHRNVSLGPWSGFSMHPLEHVIYLSTVLIHVVLPSHPIHIIFHMQWEAIGASSSHSGFEALTVRGVPIIGLTSFHHQLHHKYLDCNYGNQLVATDKWFDCNHDGMLEATTEVRRRQRERTNVSKRKTAAV